MTEQLKRGATGFAICAVGAEALDREPVTGVAADEFLSDMRRQRIESVNLLAVPRVI